MSCSSSLVTCREFIDFLMDYLSGDLPDDQRQEFDRHLGECPSCVAYMKTYKQAVEIGRSVLAPTDDPVPEDVPEDLLKAIFAARKKDG